MDIELSRLGKAVVVGVKGRVATEDAGLFEARCDQYIQKGEKSLVFDFTDLEYLSSSGLRGILSVSKKLKAIGGKLVIAGVRGKVQEIFDIAGFTSMFLMCDTLEDAVRLVV